MIYLDIKRVARMRGVENPYKMLLDLGFAPATARNFLSHSVRRVSFEHLEMICLALNCTPNDILQWLPPEKQMSPESQALNKLTRGKENELSNLLKDLPIDKFDTIIGIIQEEKKKTG